jgi:hypothetical protein
MGTLTSNDIRVILANLDTALSVLNQMAYAQTDRGRDAAAEYIRIDITNVKRTIIAASVSDIKIERAA